MCRPCLICFRKEKIERMCFYHLVYTGRGSKLREEDLTHEETRKLLDLIAAETRQMFDDGLSPEILTVDNHADGPYLYLKMKAGKSRAGQRSAGTSGNERGQQLRPRHRLCQLGRRSLSRPVLAQSAAGQCPAKAV